MSGELDLAALRRLLEHAGAHIDPVTLTELSQFLEARSPIVGDDLVCCWRTDELFGIDRVDRVCLNDLQVAGIRDRTLYIDKDRVRPLCGPYQSFWVYGFINDQPLYMRNGVAVDPNDSGHSSEYFLGDREVQAEEFRRCRDAIGPASVREGERYPLADQVSAVVTKRRHHRFGYEIERWTGGGWQRIGSCQSRFEHVTPVFKRDGCWFYYGTNGTHVMLMEFLAR
jgi:hypothetical protein